MLRALLIAALVLLGATAFANEQPQGCATIDDIKSHVDTARGDVSKWVEMTPMQVALVKNALLTVDKSVTTGWVGHVPIAGSPAFIFLFMPNGCVDGSTMMTDEAFTAMISGPTL